MEHSVLKKDLRFTLSTLANKFSLCKDLNRLVCNLTVKWYYIIHREKASLHETTEGCVESPNTDPVLHEIENDGNILNVLMELWDESRSITQFFEDLFNPIIVHTIPTSSPNPRLFPMQSKGTYVDTFYQVVYWDHMKLCQERSGRCRSNLTASETQALKALEINSNNIVRQADKGGSIVVQDKGD